MNKVLLLIFIALLILAFFGYVAYSNMFLSKTPTIIISSTPTPIVTQIEDTVDFLASFAIFTNGTKRSFSAPMYHKLSPDAYIEADNPEIIRLKKTNITWGDFFNTLPMELRKDCLVTGTKETFCNGLTGSLKFYLNGIKEDSLLDRIIEDEDRALITFGLDNDLDIKSQMDQVPDVYGRDN